MPFKILLESDLQHVKKPLKRSNQMQETLDNILWYSYTNHSFQRKPVIPPVLLDSRNNQYFQYIYRNFLSIPYKNFKVFSTMSSCDAYISSIPSSRYKEAHTYLRIRNNTFALEILQHFRNSIAHGSFNIEKGLRFKDEAYHNNSRSILWTAMGKTSNADDIRLNFNEIDVLSMGPIDTLSRKSLFEKVLKIKNLRVTNTKHKNEQSSYLIRTDFYELEIIDYYDYNIESKTLTKAQLQRLADKFTSERESKNWKFIIVPFSSNIKLSNLIFSDFKLFIVTNNYLDNFLESNLDYLISGLNENSSSYFVNILE